MAYFNGKEILFSPKVHISGNEPEGTIEITENGMHNVAEYAEAMVNVPTPEYKDGNEVAYPNSDVSTEDVLVKEQSLQDIAERIRANLGGDDEYKVADMASGIDDVYCMGEDDGYWGGYDTGYEQGYSEGYDEGQAEGGGGDTPAPTLQANFADNTWENIIWACQNNAVPDTWNVGDTKTMSFDLDDVTIAICGKGVDTYADGGVAPLTFCNYSIVYSICDIDGGVQMAENPCIFPFEENMYTYVLPSLEEMVSPEISDAIRLVKKSTRYGICPRTSDDDTVYQEWVEGHGYQQNITIKTAEKFFLFSSAEADRLFNTYSNGGWYLPPSTFNKCWLRDNAVDEQDWSGNFTFGGGYGHFMVASLDEYDGVYETGGVPCTESRPLLFGFCF